METIIYFQLDNLYHYEPEAWKTKWTSVISVFFFKKEDKLHRSYYTYINGAIVFNQRFKKKKKNRVRLALYFLNVFSGADPVLTNLNYGYFDLMTRPTITVR